MGVLNTKSRLFCSRFFMKIRCPAGDCLDPRAWRRIRPREVFEGSTLRYIYARARARQQKYVVKHIFLLRFGVSLARYLYVFI